MQKRQNGISCAMHEQRGTEKVLVKLQAPKGRREDVKLSGEMSNEGTYNADGATGLCVPCEAPEGGLQRLYTNKNAGHGRQLGLRGVVSIWRTKTWVAEEGSCQEMVKGHF